MDTDSTYCDVAESIRIEAMRLGFSACGFAAVCDVDAAVYLRWEKWINDGKHDCMQYMERYPSVRRNPQELLPAAKTVISVALNYYPGRQLPQGNPRFARYAYGQDYHEIMREKLQQLARYIQDLSTCECRVCCDTAPIFERYWAVQAGLGFTGRNSQLIIPHRGSYFFLGEVLTTLSLPSSRPLSLHCGDCRRCVDACPMGAIGEDGVIDARRCISCQTIENRGILSDEVVNKMGKRVYGCDTCQEVCPYNRDAQPTDVEELQPTETMCGLTYERMKNLTKEEFQSIFRHSAVKRVKYEGLMRNISALDALLFES